MAGKQTSLETRVVELRNKVALLREKTIQSKIAQLAKENDTLKKEIEVLKNEYDSALVANGKSVPLMANSMSMAKGDDQKHEQPKEAVKEEPKPVEKTEAAKVEEDSKKKPKKEKPVKTVNAPPAKEEKPVDFSKLDLRVGYIREVSRHPDADSLYVEQIECGDQPGNESGFGECRTVCSGLVAHMKEEDIQNRLVIVMCNLKPAKMRGVMSQGMVMCATTPDKVEFINPPPGAKAGDQVICREYPGEPERPFMNPKKKIWETLKPDLMVDENGTARFKEAPLEVEGKGLLTCKSNRKCPIT